MGTVFPAVPMYLSSTLNSPDCGGSTGSITINATGGVAPYTFIWVSLGGVTGATQTGLAVGPYIVHVFDANNCKKEIIVKVPGANSISVPLLLTKAKCPGVDNGKATVQMNPPGQYNYQWNIQPSPNSPQLTGLAANTFVSVTVTDQDSGCSGMASGTIPFQFQLGLSVSDTDLKCASDNNGTATALASQGLVPYTYAWTLNGQAAGSSPTITNLGSGIYLVKATDNQGCTASGATEITAQSNPKAAFTLTNVACEGDQVKVQFNSQATDPLSTITAWTWTVKPSGQPGFVVTGANPAPVSFPEGQEGTITLTVTSALGCSASKTEPYFIVGRPVFLINVLPPGFTCDAQPVPLAVVGNPNYTYNWTPAPGLTLQGSGPSATADPDVTTTYTLTATYQGCTTTNTVTVNRSVPLQLNLQGENVSTCSPLFPLTATASANANATIQWYQNNNLIGTGNSVTVLSSGTVAYTVVATDNFGCSETKNITLTGNAALIDVSIETSGADPCANKPILIKVSGGANYSYSWTPSASLNTSNPVQAIANPPVTTNYTLSVSNGICDSVYTVQVVRNVPDINLQVSDANLVSCSETATVTASALGSGTTLQWFSSGGNLVGQGTTLQVAVNGVKTYTVVATTLDGCTATKTVTISGQYVAPPSVTIAATSPLPCALKQYTLQVNGNPAYTYMWEPAPSLNTANPLLAIAAPSVPTTYMLHVSNGICDTTLQVVVSPTPNTSGLQVSLNTLAGQPCSSTPTLIQVNGSSQYNYTWTPSPSLNTTNPLQVLATPNLPTVYNLNVTFGTCDTTLQVLVSPVSAAVHLQVSTQVQSTCDSLSQVSATADASGATFQWFANGVLVREGPVLNMPVVGTQTYTVVATSPEGCTDEENVIVTTPGITGVSVSVQQGSADPCVLAPVVLTVSGSQDYTYSWTPDPTLNAGNPTQAIANPISSTTYTLQVSSGICDTTIQVQVVRLSTDVNVDASLPGSACEGSPLPVCVINLDPNDQLTYVWSAGGGVTISDPTSNCPTLSGSAGNYVVTVTATNQFGCTQTLTIPVTFEATGTLDNDISLDLCNQLKVDFINNSGVSGVWNFGDGQSTIGISTTHTYQSAGTYQVSFKPDSGCLEPYDTTLALSTTQLQAGFGNNLVNCTNQATIGFTDQTLHGSPLVAWSWTFSGGQPATASTPNPEVVFSQSGSITVVLVVTDIYGCIDSVSQTLQSDFIEGNLGADLTPCAGTPVALNAGGLNPNYGYTWTATPADPTLQPNNPNPLVTPTVTTTYTLSVKNGDCTATFDITVTPLLQASVNVKGGNDTLLCAIQPITLSAVANTNDITWSFNPEFSPVLWNGPNCTFTPPSNQFTMFVRAGTGQCAALDSIVVTLAPLEVQVGAYNQQICRGKTTQLKIVNGNPNQVLTYNWSPQVESVANPFVNPQNTTNYQVTVTNEAGCSTTLDLPVNVLDLDVSAGVIGTDTIALNASAEVLATANSSSGGITYQWIPAADFTNPNNAQTTVFPPLPSKGDSVVYTVIATTQGLCPDTAQVVIYLRFDVCEEPFILVPDAFTPNNDGFNDFFMVRYNEDALTELNFIVWNRWGEIVYETTDENAPGWDGRFKGKEPTPDAFAWYLEYRCGNGTLYKKKGNVTLLK
jgi:gliding motility-associated-like protein